MGSSRQAVGAMLVTSVCHFLCSALDRSIHVTPATAVIMSITSAAPFNPSHDQTVAVAYISAFILVFFVSVVDFLVLLVSHLLPLFVSRSAFMYCNDTRRLTYITIGTLH